MAFCKECGAKLEEGLKFCKNCGTKVPDSPVQEKKSFCRNCGEPLQLNIPHECKGNSGAANPTNQNKTYMDTIVRQSPNLDPSDVNTNEHPHWAPTPEPETDEANDAPVKPKGKGLKKWLISIVIALIVLAGSGGAFLYYANAQASPDKMVKEFTTALDKKNTDQLVSMIESSKGDFKKSDIEKLSASIKSDPTLFKKVKDNLNAQVNGLSQDAKEKNSPFIFEVTKKKEKKYFFINQYTITLSPVTFTVSVDEDAELFINDTEIEADDGDTRKISNLLPGVYKLTASKETEFGSFETEKEIALSETPKKTYDVVFEGDYVTVENNYSEIELYLNGEKFKTTKESSIQVGPIPPNETVTIFAIVKYPWGEAISDEYVAEANETIKLEFADSTNDIETAVFQSILEYNKSYVESITTLDSNRLRNVENPKLTETVKILEDLKSRNVYYIGNLDSVILDKNSFSLAENNGVMTAQVNVAENFNSGWKKPDAQEDPNLTNKQYFFTYKMKYNESADEWVVIETIEHKTLTIANQVVLRP